MLGIGVDGDSGDRFGRWYGGYVGFVTFLMQAGASLVWGHKKTEFEDDQGRQWHAWFEECGKPLKMKAAWGHLDIVSTPLAIDEITQILIYILLSS